jgi:hypothetical protein
MAIDSYAKSQLAQEARALLTRLARLKPFALLEPMVPAAALLPPAQNAIEQYLIHGRRELRKLVLDYHAWLQRGDGRRASAAEAQRRFTILRLRFNAVLMQFDMFQHVLVERSESDTGVWLSGLDIVSADALALPGYYEAPPVICYLDRGIGAAIRRARTRMPGGGKNPVAIVRVPRERMIGAGIASSIFHEVGHQAAALLDLVGSLRQVLLGLQRGAGPRRIAWQLWERWISEITADFWSVARLGIGSTLGLIGVVSLPRAFVFRLNVDDPHPVPWIRVRLSAAIGEALFPHPQWRRLAAVWEALYPPLGLHEDTWRMLALLEETMPAFVSVLVNHRPRSLRGRSLAEVMDLGQRRPARLAALYAQWLAMPAQMYRASPAIAFSVVAQARADNRMSPEDESEVLAKLLKHWALQSTLDVSAMCASLPTLRKAA